MEKRDPKNLKEFKKRFPLYKFIPDKEFSYIDGKWFLTAKATKQLAFQYKNKELVNLINDVERRNK